MKIEKNKIITFTGRQVDPFNLQPEDVNIVDIAHSLSHQNRYGGHTFKPYSVGIHCTTMEFSIQNIHKNEAMSLDALMHDASEAYLTDIPKPIKERIPMIDEIEANILNVIYQKYGIKHFLEVQQFDQAIVMVEISTLKMLNPLDDRNPKGMLILDVKPSTIRQKFLNRFEILTDGKFKSETEPYKHILVSR
jgi:hypothetical protein